MKSIMLFLKQRPVATVKYILVATGFFATFSNLFDCVIKNVGIERYFLYVGVLGVATIILAISKRNSVFCFVLVLIGILTIIDNETPGTLSYGILWFLFAKRIAKNHVFSGLIYFITGLSFIASSTIHGVSPADTINIILTCTGIYFIDYILPGGSF